MDIDFMNKCYNTPSDDDHMEMMFMHMEKLRDFSDISGFSIQELTNNHHHLPTNLLPNNNILDHNHQSISFNHPTISYSSNNEPYMHQEKSKTSSMAAMREMIYRIASMQPIHIDPESVKPPKRRNVKISTDPQSVAARHRREKISERIRILQRLVPGGTKMDTASMLDEAIHYVKFLKDQVRSLEHVAENNNRALVCGLGFPVLMSGGGGGGGGFPVVGKGYNWQTTTISANMERLTDS